MARADTSHMNSGLIAVHDRLLAEKPDGAEHDEATCPICLVKAADEGTGTEGPMSTATEPRTYSEDEVQAKVDAAVAAAMDAMRESLLEVDAAAEADELRAQLAESQRLLDAAMVEKAAAEEDKAKIEKFWADAVAAQQESEVAAARKDERLTKLKEVAPEGAHAYLESNGDRFAAMSDEDFQARVEEYEAITAKEAGSDVIPSTTVLTAAREGGEGQINAGSMLTELPSLRRAFDPRTL